MDKALEPIGSLKRVILAFENENMKEFEKEKSNTDNNEEVLSISETSTEGTDDQPEKVVSSENLQEIEVSADKIQNTEKLTESKINSPSSDESVNSGAIAKSSDDSLNNQAVAELNNIECETVDKEENAQEMNESNDNIKTQESDKSMDSIETDKSKLTNVELVEEVNGLNETDSKNITISSETECTENESKVLDSTHDSVTQDSGGRRKRERKKIERFVQVTKKEDIEVIGRGTALGEIPFIEKMITKYSPEELKVLHRIAYSRPGTLSEIKKNLRKFKGFGFREGDPAFERKKTVIEKIVSIELKKLLTIFGVEKKGLKNELAEKVFHFLLNPVDSGKSLPKSKRKRKSSKKKLKDSGKGKKLVEQTETTSIPEASDSDSSADSDSDAESEPEVETQPKVKKVPTKKKPLPKKKTAKRPTSASSNIDEEPVVKKLKKAPTDGDIKVYIRNILAKADLEEVTMKKLCQQVYNNYPSHDLSHKKDFIKSTVKSILS